MWDNMMQHADIRRKVEIYLAFPCKQFVTSESHFNCVSLFDFDCLFIQNIRILCFDLEKIRKWLEIFQENCILLLKYKFVPKNSSKSPYVNIFQGFFY